MNTNLVILPSRGRPESVERCVKHLKENSVISDICVAIDEDEADLYPRIDGVIYEVNERLRMNGTLNLVAYKYAGDYASTFFLGDDHVVRTPEWDLKLYAPIREKGYGLSYGNDLLQGQNLATAVMMSNNIIRSTGYMAPKKLIHLYMDNYWMAVGKVLNSMYYFDDVIIEHMHYLNGKAEQDAGYVEANSSDVYSADKVEFERYIQDEFKTDMKQLLGDLGIE